MPSVYETRFQELDRQAAVLAGKAFTIQDGFNAGEPNIPEADFLNWTQKAHHLLIQISGEGTTYPQSFEKAIKAVTYSTYSKRFTRGKAVFDAAHDDFRSGMFRSLKNLIQAEVFSVELDQASELLEAGYTAAAAVAAGVVLETTIRQLCDANDITNDKRTKLERMNEDLARKGIYNTLVQKRVTSMAAVRNAAAHGNIADYNASTVRDMISGVENFVSERLSA